MRRSVHAVSIGFAAYGALIVAILGLMAAGLALLAVAGELATLELVLATGIMGASGIAIAGPFLGTAWGLHRRAKWARWPALVLAVLIVGSAPMGTILGGYTLYTLLDEEGAAQLRG